MMQRRSPVDGRNVTMLRRLPAGAPTDLSCNVLRVTRAGNPGPRQPVPVQ